MLQILSTEQIMRMFLSDWLFVLLASSNDVECLYLFSIISNLVTNEFKVEC